MQTIGLIKSENFDNIKIINVVLDRYIKKYKKFKLYHLINDNDVLLNLNTNVIYEKFISSNISSNNNINDLYRNVEFLEKVNVDLLLVFSTSKDYVSLYNTSLMQAICEREIKTLVHIF